MAEWWEQARVVEDTPDWLSSAKIIQEKPGAFDNLGSQIVAGVGDSIAGKGMTAKELGATDVGPRVTAIGDMMRGSTPDPTQRFTQPLPGDTTIAGYSVDAVPALIARGVGNVAGELPFAAGGRILAGAAGAASTFGPELEARRQRNEGQLNTSDYLLAGGSAALQGALGALGIGAITKGVTSPAGGAAGVASRLGTAAGVEGVTGAAEGVISDLATNVGTKNSDLSTQSLIDAAVTGGVQGVGTGGTLRGGYEAARAPRVIADEIAIRSYDHREALPAMASRLQEISNNNNLNIADPKDAKTAFDIYDSELKKQKKTADKAVEAELKKQVSEGLMSETDRDKALASLKTPNKEGFDILQERVGNEPFGLDAIELAKRASLSRQARSRAGLDDRRATEVRGLLSQTGTRVKAAATGSALGAVLPTAFMSSIQSSSLAATLASAGHVAPVVGTALLGYYGIRALDKALGTNNPIRQIVDGGYRKGATSDLPGKDMESPRATKEAEEARRMQAEADRMRELRMQNLTLRNDAAAQMNQLRPTVVQAQNAERQARAAKTQAQAEAVPILTAAQAEVASARAGEMNSKTELNRIKAEIETLKKQKLEAADKGTKDTLTGQIKDLEKTLRKAQAQKSVGEGVLSGQEQPASDAPETRRMKTIERRAETVFSFEKQIRKKAGDQADAIMESLEDLKQRVNNFNDGLAALEATAERFPDHAAFIRRWWLKPDAALKDTRLGSLFTFNDGDKIGVIMTREEAEARRFGNTANED